MSVKSRALDLLDSGCWSREATVIIIKELLKELDSCHEAIDDIKVALHENFPDDEKLTDISRIIEGLEE